MLRFWQNPEFVRHARAELRQGRVLSALFVTLIVCLLVGLSCWSAQQNRPPAEFFETFYATLFAIQAGLLSLWSLSACASAISGERDMKTFDFQRTTRLTAGELLMGKVTGVPVMPYVIVGGTVPVTLVSGLLGGYGLGAILASYLVVLVFALMLSLFGLWISMLMEKSHRGLAGLAFFILYPFSMIGFGLDQTVVPGLGALSPLAAIFALHEVRNSGFRSGTAAFFGFDTPVAVISIVLYVSIGFWLALMIVRNLKRDLDQVQLLSRWQSIGLAFHVNLLLYGLVDGTKLVRPKTTGAYYGLDELIVLVLVMNSFIMLAVGLATLTPPERLKVWWRRRAAEPQSFLSEDGLPWAWVVLAGVMGYAMMLLEGVALGWTIPMREWDFGRLAFQMLALMLFVLRDVLFLQWCCLTRLKSPVTKGFLYLVLYYATAGVIALVVGIIQGESAGLKFLGAFTPVGAYFTGDTFQKASSGVFLSLVLQSGAVALLLKAIADRLSRPAKAAVWVG